nr:DEAD/DEAH box helicase [Rubrobacter sp.]
MDVFELRNRLVQDYGSYVDSFIRIKDARIEEEVRRSLDEGLLWPDPLIQLNPSFEAGETVDELVEEGILHEECARVFRASKGPHDPGKELRLHLHQAEAIRTARAGYNYVLTTGTGSGKSLAYIVPVVDHVLRRGPGRGIQAIVVYPMNALANSQYGELEKFLQYGYPDGKGPVTFARYTGQESDEKRQRIIANPPDILLTNYVMLELILTRSAEQGLSRSAQGLGFLVFDELHTYRGRQGADVAFLIRRVRELLAAEDMRCVGTSATIAGSGTYEEQRAEISDVAGRLFGAELRPENVIGETLRRATPEKDLGDPALVEELTGRVRDERKPPQDYRGFTNDSLSVWIESTFGVAGEPETERLIRAQPKSISGPQGAAKRLSDLTGLPEQRCASAIEEGLLAGYECEPEEQGTGRPPFAFRLHQFVSRGDAVYASIEEEERRYITFKGQQYVPEDRSRVLMPLAFCRECGQEYYPVREYQDSGSYGQVFRPRGISDAFDDGESEAGFLFFSTAEPWPAEDTEDFWERLPSDWMEEHRGAQRVRKDRRQYVPRPVTVAADGTEDAEGLEGHYFPAPFRFCLSCGISYALTLRSDFTKLGSLGSEGRSTATTILSLSAISGLKEAEDLRPEARKILSFTDNRQDASLQAGHFNDFVEIGLLRSALHRAVAAAGEAGLSHDELTPSVFEALDLPFEQYASNPLARFKAKSDTEAALRDVLGYRIYRDLERGWRITSPNLEQCGLLKISYESLEEVCEADDVWEDAHPALLAATPET